MRKIIILISLLFYTTALYAASFTIKADVDVNDVSLSWSQVDGAIYYDIYRGSDFIVRLDKSASSYTIEDERQNADFVYIIGARDKDNKTLAASKVSVKTESFEGVYQWVNPTKKTNGGKLTEITLRLELAEDPVYGQYMKIYSLTEIGERCFFPIFPLDSTDWPWVEYDSDSDEAITYRVTCEKFNSSPFTPSSFRQSRLEIHPDYVRVDMQSRALGFEVTTTSTFSFYSENGELFLDYSTSGSGLAKTAIFKNPVGDDPWVYTLSKIK